MKTLLIAAVALVGILSATVKCANAQAIIGETSSHLSPAKLENVDVVEMVKAGLPEEIIVAKVQGTPGNFDTSPAALSALKASLVPNAVILAMVKKSDATSTEEDRVASSVSLRAGGTLAVEHPRATAQQVSKSCLAVKPIGSHVIRNMLILGALPGALISHQQYQVVNAVDYPAKIGQKYHGNDLQTIQGNGTKVVLLDKHYSADELHVACHQ